MIIKTINNRTFLFVEVPEASEGVLTRYAFSGWYYVLKSNDLNSKKCFIGNAKDRFVLIGLAPDLTEDEWKGIVRELPVGERYENYIGDYPIWLHSAKASASSLLLSLNLNPHTTLIIEKK